MPLHSWTRCVLLVFLVALPLMVEGVSAGAQQRQDQDAQQRKVVEKELRQWRRGKQNAAVPTRQLACVAEDLSGSWEIDGLVYGSTLRLFPLGSNRYRVQLYTGGRKGDWTLERTAIYRQGVLLLNHPIKEYNGLIYDRLFTIRTSVEVHQRTSGQLTTSMEVHLISDQALAIQYKYKANHTNVPGLWFHGFRHTTRTIRELSNGASPTHKPPLSGKSPARSGPE